MVDFDRFTRVLRYASAYVNSLLRVTNSRGFVKKLHVLSNDITLGIRLLLLLLYLTTIVVKCDDNKKRAFERCAFKRPGETVVRRPL